MLKLVTSSMFKMDCGHMFLFKLSNRQCKYLALVNEMVYCGYPTALWKAG